VNAHPARQPSNPLQKLHTAASYIALILFGSFALALAISSLNSNWSLGPFHPSPLSHTMPEEDFFNLWSAGNLVRESKLDWIYSSELFDHWKHVHFDPAILTEDWIYPPTVLLIGVPFSYLPLVPAFLLWNLLTTFGAVAIMRSARLPWSVIAVGLAGTASWRSLALGQYGIITGAFVIAGLVIAPRHPIRAGILLGFVTLKPQQGVIVPIAWLASRSWRAIASAALTFGILAAAVGLWLGPQSWALFLTHSRSMARAILEAPPPQPNINTGTSVFWMCRTMGSTVAAATYAQLLAGSIAVWLAYKAWRKHDVDSLTRVAFTVCLSLMVTPYGYTSDMVAFSIAVAIILRNDHWQLRLVHVFLWLWPLYCIIVTIETGILLTPPVVAIAAYLAWRQMHRTSEGGEMLRQP
jgi:hypothetical protein